MSFEYLFSLSNTIALFAWIALMAAPYHNKVRQVIFGGVVVAFGICYALLFFTSFDAEMSLSMTSLKGLASLFSSEQAVLLGWVHYLAFDLVAGLYITKNAQENHLHKRALLPFLIGTFMAGPLGLTAYVLFRTIQRKHYKF